MEKALVVLCTCPAGEPADKLAEGIIDAKLAACVNQISGIRSVYRWQGKRESSIETLLIIKTNENSYSQLEQYIVAHHPYELPEIIGVPIEAGYARYLQWIAESVIAR